MLRTLLVIVTALSVVAGSFGLTSYRHVCSMMGVMQPVDKACGMCSHRGPHSEEEEIAATPCCSFTTTVHRTPDSVLTRVELPAPALQSMILPPAIAHLLEIAPRSARPVSTFESPPPFALRGQSTYLVNSVFLI
jgi:hypothetical protein